MLHKKNMLSGQKMLLKRGRCRIGTNIQAEKPGNDRKIF